MNVRNLLLCFGMCQLVLSAAAISGAQHDISKFSILHPSFGHQGVLFIGSLRQLKLLPLNNGSYLRVRQPEPRARLFSEKDSHEVLIVRTLGDLCGKVDIGSAQQAIDFVRLRSYMFATPLLDVPWLEVLAEDTISPSAFVGDVSLEQLLRRSDSGYCGVVSREEMNRLHIPETDCIADGARFVVRRTVIELNGRSSTLLALMEIVGPHGEYSCSVLERRPWNGEIATIRWRPFPYR